MGWHDEQELLLADTLVCVEIIDGASAPLVPDTPVRRLASKPQRPSDIDIRREIQERLSVFRQRFAATERDVYYEQAMQRIRAVTEQRT